MKTLTFMTSSPFFFTDKILFFIRYITLPQEHWNMHSILMRIGVL